MKLLKTTIVFRFHSEQNNFYQSSFIKTNMTSSLSKLGVALGAFFVLTLSGTASSSTKPTINVGIYAPFSNHSASIGRSMLGAMEMARDQIKSSEINYEFYTLDTHSDHANDPATLQKFIDAHHINILMTEGAASGALVVPLAKKNNLIHFCLTSDELMTDGKNNFVAQSPNHQHAAVLIRSMNPKFVAQFQQEYFNNPVTEAGYAFDIFKLLNQSAIIAMKSKAGVSSQSISSHLLALQSGKGIMGAFNLDKKGLSYKKGIMVG